MIYVILLLYLNSTYNTRLISSFLSKTFPGKVYIDEIKINNTLTQLDIKGIKLIEPTGETVLIIKNATGRISPIKLIKNIISKNYLTIDSLDIETDNLIIKFDKKGDFSLLNALVEKTDKNYQKIFENLYQNDFLFYSDKSILKKSNTENSFTMLINNINIKGNNIDLDVPTLNANSENWIIKNGSFELSKDDVLLRADLEVRDLNLVQSSENRISKLKLDSIKLYAIDITTTFLELKAGYINLKDSLFKLEGKLEYDILSNINFTLTSDIKTSIIGTLLVDNNIKMPENIKLGNRVSLSGDLFGTIYYPMANFSANMDKLNAKDFSINNGVIDGYYQFDKTEVNLYIRNFYYNNPKTGYRQRVDRLRTKLFFDNKQKLQTENLSFNIGQSRFKTNGNFDVLSGKLDNFNVQLDNFNPKSIMGVIPIKIPYKFQSFLNGNLNLTLDASANDLFTQTGIESNIILNYRFAKRNLIGKFINFKTKVKLDNGIIRFSKNTLLNNGSDKIALNGSFNQKNKRVSLYTNIKVNKIERFLKYFNIKEDIKGDLALRGDINGYLLNPKGKLHLEIKNFDYLHYKNSFLSTDLKLSNGELELYGFSLQNKDFHSFITGKIKLFNKNVNNILKDPEFSTYIGLTNVNIGSITQRDDIDMVVNSRIMLSGTFKNPEGDINITSNNFILQNEKFDSIDLDLELLKKDGNSILDIKNFVVKQNEADFLLLDGIIDINKRSFKLYSFIPRISLEKLDIIKKQNNLIYGDLISKGVFSGNFSDFKKLTFNYKLDFRFASFLYPYQVEVTKTIVKPSDEFGKPNEIIFKDVKIDKMYNLGDGLLTIKGNEKDLFIDGKLFKIFKIDSKISDLMNHPISDIKVYVNKLPLHRFHNYPLKTITSLDIDFKYDLKKLDILAGRVIFDEILLKNGDIVVKTAQRKLDNESFCVVGVGQNREKKNCIEYRNGKFYLDTIFSFIGENISLSGKFDLKEQDMAINLTGGIDLNALTFFKDIFASIDGKAYLFASVKGKFTKPKYNLRLRIQNTAFQLIDFDKNVTINNATFNLNNEKLYIKNFKGDILGGTFEIAGDKSNRGLIFDLNKNITFVTLRANNLQYTLPEKADVETSLDLKLSGPIKKLYLKGDIKILDGKIYQSINIMEKLFGNLTEKTDVYEESFDLGATPILNNIGLDLNIINNGITISNDLVDDILITSDLKIGGVLGAPIIDGTLTANDGQVKLLSHIFELTNFMIKFNKADIMLSEIEFESEAIIKDLVGEEYFDRNVYLKITGNVADPKVELLGEGLTKLQTMFLLLTGESGVSSNSNSGVDENTTSKLTNQFFAILLQNALQRITSDVEKQINLSLKTTIDSDGNLSVSANQMIGKRIRIKGTGEFKNNTFQKKILVEVILIDQLVLEALKAFEEGNTDLLLKYRLEF